MLLALHLPDGCGCLPAEGGVGWIAADGTAVRDEVFHGIPSSLPVWLRYALQLLAGVALPAVQQTMLEGPGRREHGLA